MYTGLFYIISLFQALSLVPSAKSLLTCEATYSQGLGVRIQIFWRVILLSTTEMNVLSLVSVLSGLPLPKLYINLERKLYKLLKLTKDLNSNLISIDTNICLGLAM